MKYFLLILLFTVGCASTPKQTIPKYKVNDCIMFGTLSVKDGILDGSGAYMISFKIMGISKSIKNTYMNERFTSDVYYILKNLTSLEPERPELESWDNLVLPVKDVDNFSYADKFSEYVNQNNCNPLEAK